jgi:hypothetical protein
MDLTQIEIAIIWIVGHVLLHTDQIIVILLSIYLISTSFGHTDRESCSIGFGKWWFWLVRYWHEYPTQYRHVETYLFCLGVQLYTFVTSADEPGDERTKFSFGLFFFKHEGECDEIGTTYTRRQLVELSFGRFRRVGLIVSIRTKDLK